MFFTPALSRAAFLGVPSWRRRLSVVLSKDCAEPAARKRIAQAPAHPVRLQRLIVSLSILHVLAIVHSSLFCSPALSMAHISVPLPNEHHINWNFLIKSRQKKKTILRKDRRNSAFKAISSPPPCLQGQPSSGLHQKSRSSGTEFSVGSNCVHRYSNN